MATILCTCALPECLACLCLWTSAGTRLVPVLVLVLVLVARKPRGSWITWSLGKDKAKDKAKGKAKAPSTEVESQAPPPPPPLSSPQAFFRHASSGNCSAKQPRPSPPRTVYPTPSPTSLCSSCLP